MAAFAPSPGACMGCGCTERSACPGGCGWETDRLCSRCADVAAGRTDPPDCTVVCERCGRRQRVRFAEACGEGWPWCHGYTMRLTVPPPDIGAAFDEAAGLGALLLLPRVQR